MPYEAIAYDIAANTEQAGRPQLVLFAIVIGCTNHCSFDLGDIEKVAGPCRG